MANTFFGLTIGSSGLFASNASINTTAHNISNVNTEGYTKQVTNISSSASIRVHSTYGTVGTGVTVDSITQMRSNYYDTKYWDNNVNYGEYSTIERYSLLIEDYLDEFNLEGFVTEYDNLFSTIMDLNNDPTSEVARNQFVNYASSICSYFNTLSSNLSDVQKSANDEVKTTVDSINTIAEQIASLNKQINVIEINRGEANDLRDARALLVDELSKYVNTSISEKEIGNGATEYIVRINDQILVDGYSYNRLICEARETGDRRNASDIDGLYKLKWDNGLNFNVYNSALRGSLKAAIDIRDGCNSGYEILGMIDENGEFYKRDGEVVRVYDLTEDEYDDLVNQGYHKELSITVDGYRNTSYKGVPYYQQQLNEFIRVFANEFNSTIKGEDDTVVDFFTNVYEEKYVSASNVTVNPDIVKDLTLLPYSYDPTQGAANIDMVSALYKLKEAPVIDNGTFAESLSTICSVIFIDTKRASTFAENYDNIRTTIDNQRLSVSGVDEDEEAVDLVKFKEAYSLSSKVISVMQEIYNKLINETGL